MSRIERNIQVSYRHQALFTQDVFATENPVLRDVLNEEGPRERHKVLIVVDEALSRACKGLVEQIEAYFHAHSDVLDLVVQPIVIEGGERTKNSYFHVSEIHSHAEKNHVDRHSYLIAVGGGALLDMVGLAAATAHRGVRHVRIPTTTLSQNDSGVGVKNGINSFGKKNFVGTFAPPFAVINDFKLLESLPERDRRCGFSEAVKVALIRDTAFFDEIEAKADALRGFDPAAMQRLIFRCAELHMDHIATSGDPFEFGSARPLDFGHWAAHKLEQVSNYQIRHGEAVAIGLALDVVYARLMGFLDGAACERVLRLLERLGFELFASDLVREDKNGQFVILEGIEEFREHLGGRLTITLIRAIGEGFEINEMIPARVLDAIFELERRHRRRGEKSLRVVA